MKPLEVNVAQYGEANPEQIRECLKRGLPEITPAPFSHTGRVVVVGSGFSLPDMVEEIKKERERGRPIWAINGAYDYLVTHGLTPEGFLTVDPRPMPQNFEHPQHETIFMLASRCHPTTFDLLKDYKVLVWHSWSKDEENSAFEGRVGIGGGTTSGLRAINVGYVLGFRNFVLYGMDSCNAPDGTTKRFDGGQSGAIIDVIVNGKKFLCNYGMAQQAQDFQQLYDVMPDLHINVKGGGLLAEILKIRQERGMAA